MTKRTQQVEPLAAFMMMECEALRNENKKLKIEHALVLDYERSLTRDEQRLRIAFAQDLATVEQQNIDLNNRVEKEELKNERWHYEYVKCAMRLQSMKMAFQEVLDKRYSIETTASIVNRLKNDADVQRTIYRNVRRQMESILPGIEEDEEEEEEAL